MPVSNSPNPPVPHHDVADYGEERYDAGHDSNEGRLHVFVGEAGAGLLLHLLHLRLVESQRVGGIANVESQMDGI